jgi:hypothetical protein
MKTSDYQIESYSIAVMGNMDKFRKYIQNYRKIHYTQKKFTANPKITNKPLIEEETQTKATQIKPITSKITSIWSKVNLISRLSKWFQSKNNLNKTKDPSILEKHDNLITKLYRVSPSSLTLNEGINKGTFYIFVMTCVC